MGQCLTLKIIIIQLIFGKYFPKIIFNSSLRKWKKHTVSIIYYISSLTYYIYIWELKPKTHTYIYKYTLYILINKWYLNKPPSCSSFTAYKVYKLCITKQVTWVLRQRGARRARVRRQLVVRRREALAGRLERGLKYLTIISVIITTKHKMSV